MRELTATAAPGDAGRRLNHFVRGTMGVSAHQFASLKRQDGLLVNGEPVHADYLLREGDAVTVVVPEGPGKDAAPEEGPVPVVYEDADILILDKPAPLACQCSPKQPSGTLENRLAFRYRDRPGGFTFRPLNRLDKGTSGLMAAAMNAHACQALQRQLHTEAFAREYLAVVDGCLAGEGVVNAPIAKADGATVRRVVDPDGRPALTRYRVVASGREHSLVRLRLETGRTHQIRVHMAHLGHPVSGDFLYGAEDPRLPGRFALHSTLIRLTHPVTGEVMTFESPLPEALERLMKETM